MDIMRANVINQIELSNHDGRLEVCTGLGSCQLQKSFGIRRRLFPWLLISGPLVVMKTSDITPLLAYKFASKKPDSLP